MRKVSLKRGHEKKSSIPAPRRTTRLTDAVSAADDAEYSHQLSGSVIHPDDPEQGPLLQTKMKTHTPMGWRWTVTVYDQYQSQVAIAALMEKEETAWAVVSKQLEAKGIT